MLASELIAENENVPQQGRDRNRQLPLCAMAWLRK